MQTLGWLLWLLDNIRDGISVKIVKASLSLSFSQQTNKWMDCVARSVIRVFVEDNN